MRLYCAACHGGIEADGCGWCSDDGWFTVGDVFTTLARDVAAVVRNARIRLFGWSRRDRARVAELSAQLDELGIRQVSAPNARERMRRLIDDGHRDRQAREDELNASIVARHPELRGHRTHGPNVDLT